MSTRDDPAEVARAQAFLEQQRAREAWQRQNLAALSGSRTARADLADRFSPLKADPEYPEVGPS